MSKCNEKCKEKRNNELEVVPYIAYEAAMFKANEQTKKAVVAFLIAISLLFVTNIGWLTYYERCKASNEKKQEINLITSDFQGDFIDETGYS